jgi:hypothetical protein
VTAPFTAALPLGGSRAAAAARQLIAFYIGGMGDYYKEVLTRFGFGEDCKEIAELYQTWATRARAVAAVSDRMIEAVAITGDPAQCIEELRRRRSYGLDLPILNLPTDMPLELVERFIQAMAPR